VNWALGYGLGTNVLDGAPDLSIDAHTGRLTVVPQQLGLYALAIAVEEYRGGEKIAESRNELQYFVTNCPQRTAPEITWMNSNLRTIEPMRESCFDFEIADVDGDSLSIGLKNIDPLFQNILTYTIDRSVQPHLLKVCLDVACNFTRYEDIGFEVWVSDNSCPVPLKDSLKLNIDLNGLTDGNPFKSIPNVFSPNKDGINDVFYIKGNLPNECIDDFEIKIYNRWGKMVYESRDFSFRWIGDGLDPGVYFYVMKIKELEKIGYLTLIL
jgi:gliding motility-associated-like protein